MNNSDTEIVSALKLSIAERIGSDRFGTWFRKTRIEHRDGTVRILAAHEFALNILRNRIRDEIEEACQLVIGESCKVEFLVDANCTANSNNNEAGQSNAGESSESAGHRATNPDAAANSESSDPSTDATKARQPRSPKSQLRTHNDQTVGSKRKFASLNQFAAGQSNRIAISSAEHVSANPGIVSPLFLYGATGIGKSHLAEGIWSRVRRSADRLRCVYLSAEQFTSYFLQALNGSGLPTFRQRYRNVDLLVIEDVQFFARKRATIVELQHTIDSVLRDGRQMVITADRPPNELGELGDEMVNRFTGGLVIRVESPDREARQQILRQRAAALHMELPEEVVDFVADHLTEDVRKLQGALNRLDAVSRATGQPVTMGLAAKALDDIVQANKKVVGLSDIEQAVCDIFEVSPTHLRSSTKSRRLAHPRMLAMALARKHTRAGLAEIGEFFGRRSHATVISASKKVQLWQSDGSSVRMFDQECPVKDAIRRVERRLLG